MVCQILYGKNSKVMKRLILVSAGANAWEEESLAEEERRLQGILPLPLSESGKEALKEIAEIVRQQKADVIYSSGNESSGPTAEYLVGLCGLKAKKEAALRELNCGLWQGLKIKEIKKRFGKAYRQWRIKPASICPPEGEAVTEVFVRVSQALQVINRKNKGKTVVIVAAPVVSALIECAITERSLDELWQIAGHGEALRIFELAEEDHSGRTKKVG